MGTFLERVLETVKMSPHIEMQTEEDGGVLFITNQEVFGVMDTLSEDRVQVSYLGLDRDAAMETMKNCPESISEWRTNLLTLHPQGRYDELSYCRKEVSLDEARNIIFYMLFRMGSTEQIVHRTLH